VALCGRVGTGGGGPTQQNKETEKQRIRFFVEFVIMYRTRIGMST
jgi:hypothetical protein